MKSLRKIIIPIEDIQYTEYNLDFQKSELKNILFHKLSPKIINDEEEDIICEDEDDEDIENNNTINKINHLNIKIKNNNNTHNNNNNNNNKIDNDNNNNIDNDNIDTEKLKYKNGLLFPINYEYIYNGINDFYYPMTKYITSKVLLINNSENIITILENYIKSNSIFQPLLNNNDCNSYIYFLYKLKENEEILLSIFIFLIENILNLRFECCKPISKKEIDIIFKELNILFPNIYESIILIYLYNYNIKKGNNIEIKISSYENLCINYIKELDKKLVSLNIYQIIIKLNKIQKLLVDKLKKITDRTIYLYYETNGYDLNKFSNEFLEQLLSYENLSNIYNKSEEEEEKKKKINSKEILNNTLSQLKKLINKTKIKIPFLPKINNDKYKYSLVIDLDETLVHYIEEEKKAYVKIRPYADYFLNEMGKYFELIIFTAAEENYADLVLNELDKNKIISYKLYRKHTQLLNGIFFKDLSKLGRDIQKICIIDNNKLNFSLQPDNGLHISSFLGDLNDNELFLLCNDLMKIIHWNKDDIRPIIKDINNIMQKRYMQFNAILE